MIDKALADLSHTVRQTYQQRTQSWVRVGGHGLAMGLEERKVPNEYFWDGTKRGGNPNFPYLVFQYTLDGWGCYADSSVQKIMPGMAFAAIVPSEHRYYLPNESKGWTFIWMIMWHQYVVSRIKQRNKKLGSVISAGAHSPMTLALIRLFEGVCRNSFHDEFALESAMFDWMIEYDRTAQNVLYPRSPMQELMESTRQFVLKNLDRGISVQEIAAEHAMSRSHFGHHFKAVTGLGPAEYITQIRLDEASKRLAESDDKLERIARETGFADANHFCKVFRRNYHTSPGKFRQQLGKR